MEKKQGRWHRFICLTYPSFGLLAVMAMVMGQSVWAEGTATLLAGGASPNLGLPVRMPAEQVVGPADPLPDRQDTAVPSRLSESSANIAPADYPRAWIQKVPTPDSADTEAFQLFPEGLIYRSYLAGMKEPRLAGMWVHEKEQGWLWDAAVGARAGILRYGTQDPLRPEGWQLDTEAAVFPRLSPEGDRDLISADYRVGIPLTVGSKDYQVKLAWYHLSSHLGDEFLLHNPGYPRVNYSRDAIVLGNSFYLTDDVRLYAEAEWAYYTDGGTEPWAFQFGVDYSPAEPVGRLRGAPFVAVNAHLREEVDFGGNLVVQAGWQWRGQSGHLFRFGMQYFNGKSDQFEFFRRSEDRLGLGIWYDF